MRSKGQPSKPLEKKHRNPRVVRLNDFFDKALLEIADEDGIAPAALARKFVQEGIRRRMKEKRGGRKNEGVLTV